MEQSWHIQFKNVNVKPNFCLERGGGILKNVKNQKCDIKQIFHLILFTQTLIQFDPLKACIPACN